jgi:hypothetical protein
VLDSPLRAAESRGFIARQGDAVRASDSGRTWLNQLTALFLP